MEEMKLSSHYYKFHENAKMIARDAKLKDGAKNITNALDLSLPQNTDERVRILQTAHSGDVWQFQMYIPNEKRYLRKSLRTRDEKIAINKAEKLFIETKKKIKNNQPVLSQITPIVKQKIDDDKKIRDNLERGIIYILKVDFSEFDISVNRYKIGKTSQTAHTRKSSIGSPVPLKLVSEHTVPLYHLVEKFIHGKYKEFRQRNSPESKMHNEYFDLTEDQLEEIEIFLKKLSDCNQKKTESEFVFYLLDLFWGDI
jgi:hypothetical protein